MKWRGVEPLRARLQLMSKPCKIHKGHTLRRASGPGSINAEADMRQLVMQGRADEAAELWRAHHAIRGARPMEWGAMWMEYYRRGDTRAQGVTAVGKSGELPKT